MLHVFVVSFRAEFVVVILQAAEVANGYLVGLLRLYDVVAGHPFICRIAGYGIADEVQVLRVVVVRAFNGRYFIEDVAGRYTWLGYHIGLYDLPAAIVQGVEDIAIGIEVVKIGAAQYRERT